VFHLSSPARDYSSDDDIQPHAPIPQAEPFRPLFVSVTGMPKQDELLKPIRTPDRSPRLDFVPAKYEPNEP